MIRTTLMIGTALLGVLVVGACGSADQSSTDPATDPETDTASDTAATAPIEVPQTAVVEAAMVQTTTAASSTAAVGFVAQTEPAPTCSYLNYPPVEPPFRSSVGAFTHVPFQPADLSMISNGIETNDPRFSYQWIKSQSAEIPIYAPADGVLVRIRHKTFRPNVFESDDYDLFFMISCDTLVRFNHITSPREDIAAAYQFGDQPSVDFHDDGTMTEHDDRQIPSSNIRVEAGDIIGYTSGTPQAHDFDFMVSVDNHSVCPFSVFDEPAKSALLGLLGPKSASPNGPPQPGFDCVGYGAAP